MRHPHRAGNVLYLKTERESSEFFNLIKAASNGDNTFVLAGDGTLQMYKVGKAGLERVPEYFFFSVKNLFSSAGGAGYAPTIARVFPALGNVRHNHRTEP